MWIPKKVKIAMSNLHHDNSVKRENSVLVKESEMSGFGRGHLTIKDLGKYSFSSVTLFNVLPMPPFLPSSCYPNFSRS